MLGSGARGAPGQLGLRLGGGSTGGGLPSGNFPAAISEWETHVKERKWWKRCRIRPGRRHIPAQGCSSLSLPAWPHCAKGRWTQAPQPPD